MTPRLTRNVLVACGVILADLALKALVAALWEPGARTALVPGLLGVGHVATGSPVPGLLAEAEGWRRSALAGFGGLVLLWLLDLLRRGEGPARWAAGSLYLIAAGVVSNTLDLVVMGRVTRYLLPGDAGLALNLADLAILGGLAWLAGAAVRFRGVPERSLLPLARAPAFDVPLERFPRGVDNVRVDVRLSPRFTRELRRVVAGLVAQEIAGGRGAALAPGALGGREDFEALRAAYGAMLEAAAHRARREGGRIERVQLLQLGVLKAVQEAVRAEIEGVLQGLRGSLREERTRATEGLELYEHLVRFAKRRPRVQYTVARRVWTQLMQVEAGPAAELRRSLLGTAWALPREVLDNPLLHATDPTAPELLMRHYVLLGHRSEDRQTYVCVEREVEALFVRAGAERARPGLPPRVRRLHWYAWDEAVEPEVLRRRVRRDLDHAVPGTEVPDNVDLLLDGARTWEAMEAARRRGDMDAWNRLRLHRRFQELELRRLEDAFRDHGVLGRIVASYEVVPLYRDHYRGINPLLLLQYLSGGPGAARALEKIRAALGARGRRDPRLAPLRAAARRVRRCPARRRRELVRRYLRDFLAYRRDLRCYFLTRALLEQLRLVESAEEVRLSRANRALQDFPGPGESDEDAAAARGHVIVKADLRGSMRITRELVRRGLNPATHFDLHFFGPVNELLLMFGAEKVFLEGDAVIAGILEPEGGMLPRMAVARACGLARAIVDLVRAHNAGCRRHGLPELEVGVGIAWCPEPPAYLYDGDRPITISPAIGLADRLSSCARFLREATAAPPGVHAMTWRVPPSHPLAGEKGERELHYNVNGVLLHREAFPQLAEEIRLGRVELEVAGLGSCAFYGGRYLDARGSTRRLTLREGRVRELEPRGEAPARYYEVVVDEALAARVWRRLEPAGAEAREPRGPLR